MPSYVSDKFTLLRELVKGKSVLDIGCVQHSWDTLFNDSWIHNVLKESAKSVKGIDILRDDIDQLRKMGFDVEYGDAEDFDLGNSYTCIYAGEIIEHLANPGRFLECSREHLDMNGKLVITTVNCFSVLFFALRLFKKLQVNNEHTCWYDEITLTQLLNRYGFIVENVYYFHRYETSSNPIKIFVSRIFNKICPRNMRDNLLVVASIKP